MAEYIEREKAFKLIKEQKEKETGAYSKGRNKGLITAGSIINNKEVLPAADVVKVKHGEWVYHECVSSHEGAISGYSCSECCSFVDEEVFDMDEFHKDYCGNCGARMDGKDINVPAIDGERSETNAE